MEIESVCFFFGWLMFIFVFLVYLDILNLRIKVVGVRLFSIFLEKDL